MPQFASLGLILALAFLTESLTEYFFADLFATWHLDKRFLRHVAALLGVVLSLVYGIDAFGPLLGISARLPFLGEILTGLLLGRGANFLHDFYSKYVVARK